MPRLIDNPQRACGKAMLGGYYLRSQGPFLWTLGTGVERGHNLYLPVGPAPQWCHLPATLETGHLQTAPTRMTYPSLHHLPAVGLVERINRLFYRPFTFYEEALALGLLRRVSETVATAAVRRGPVALLLVSEDMPCIHGYAPPDTWLFDEQGDPFTISPTFACESWGNYDGHRHWVVNLLEAQARWFAEDGGWRTESPYQQLGAWLVAQAFLLAPITEVVKVVELVSETMIAVEDVV